MAVFRHPRPASTLFDETDTNGFYYVVWRRDGQEMKRSTNAPAGLDMPVRGNPQDQTRPPTRGTFREMYHFTPPGEVIAIGRSITRDLAELRRTAWTLAAVGGGVLCLGL